MMMAEQWCSNAVDVGCVTTDAHFHMLYADAAYFHYFGDDVIYSILRTVHEADAERLCTVAAGMRDGQTEQLVLRMRGCAKDWRWMLVRLTVHGDGDARQYQMRLGDVFALQRLLTELTRENTDYRFLLHLMRNLTFRYSFRTKRLQIVAFDCAREICLTDLPLLEWKQQAIEKRMVEQHDVTKFEKLCSEIAAGASQFQCELETSLCSQGNRMEYCLFRGVTRSDAPGVKSVLGTISFLHAKYKTKEPSWLLETARDPATDLMAKTAITAYAKAVLSQRTEGITTLVLLNVDDFKEINNRYGHMFGDEVLFTLAHILKTEIGARGAAGRIGGGMFMLVLEGIADETDLRGILRAIRTKFEWAWERGATEYSRPHITCSMGAACCPIDADEYEKLFMQADKALYIACEKGHNRYVIYDVKKHGAVVPNRERSVADLYANVPTQSKAGFVAEVANALLADPLPDISALLIGIGSQFGIDGIHIFTAPDWGAAYSWGHPVSGTAQVLLQAPFYSGFQADHVCVIDHINALEGLADDAYQWFTGENLLGTVLYRVLHNDTPIAVISFALFGRFRKWSTLDVNHLTVLGGILGGLLRRRMAAPEPNDAS